MTFSLARSVGISRYRRFSLEVERRLRWTRTAVLTSFVVLSARNILDSDCTSQADPMIVATVEHAESGELLNGEVTLVAYDANARDSVTYPLSASSIATLTLYEGRLSGGTYTVDIRLAGYQTWRREEVLVREESTCHHTIPTALFASMVRL
jgi:hypothetical protein